MSESSKPNETADDLDLENGEVESDNGEAEVIIAEDENVATPKHPFAQNPKNDATSSPSHKAKDGANDRSVDG